MPYTPAAPGLYGQSYKVGLNPNDREVVGAVREPNLIFERVFLVSINMADTTGGILVQEDGQPDLYLWKVLAAGVNQTFELPAFGFSQGQGLRLWCAAGSLIFSWRERYRLDT